MGGAYGLGSFFALQSWQMIMLALLLMVGSFYFGTLFGNNVPIYVSHLPSNSTSSSLLGTFVSLCYFFEYRIQF